MERFLQQVVDGVATGAVYGAVAVALVLIFRTTGLINFAQGELALLSTFAVWQLHDWGVPLVVGALAAIAASFAAGCVIERALIRRLARRDALAAVVVTLGLYLVIDGLIRLVWGAEVKSLPGLFSADTLRLGGVAISWQSLGTLVVLAAVVAALFALLYRTPLGLAMRAAADRPDECGLLGIPAERMFMLGWGLAAALGALAGTLVAPLLFVQPDMMGSVLVYAFAAAVLGGLDSPLGAVVAGLLVGVVENVAGSYVGVLGTDLKVTVAFALILVVLLVRPAGLFGSPPAVRV